VIPHELQRNNGCLCLLPLPWLHNEPARELLSVPRLSCTAALAANALTGGRIRASCKEAAKVRFESALAAAKAGDMRCPIRRWCLL